MKFLVLSAFIATASALTYTNDAARAAVLIADAGASRTPSDLNIHPVHFYNAGLAATGLSYPLVGHPNGAVVPAEPFANQAARAAHLSGGATYPLASAHVAAYTNDAARAAELIADAGASRSPSDLNIHPVHFFNAGLAAAGLSYPLVGHPNGAVVPAETFANQAARAAHLSGGATFPVASAQVAAYTNDSARAAVLIADAGATRSPSDLNIHPVHFYNAGLEAAGLSYALVGHPNGAVVPVDSVANQAARAAHLSGGATLPVASAQVAAYTNDAARAAVLIADAGATRSPSDLNIHPVHFYNAGLKAAGLHYVLVGHPNGAVVPAEPFANQAARAAHLFALEA